MSFDVRKAFYAMVCFVTLGLSAWGAYTILSVGMRMYIFTEADRYYSGESAKLDELAEKNARARRQNDFSWAVPVLIINLPMFFLFYPEVEKKE